jgi:hypothetical protein
MRLRSDIQKRIEKKQEEARELGLRIRETNAYIQGLLDTLKMLPKDADDISTTLRPDTQLAKARDAILRHHAPMHITDLLKALNRPVDRKSRASLGGSLSAYVNRGEIFTRPAPNTYGLIEMAKSASGNGHDDGEPPESFGLADVEEEQGVEEPE